MSQSKTIHKFILHHGRENLLYLPVGSKAFKAGAQNTQNVLWIELEPSLLPTQARKFAIFGTGWMIPKDAEYIDTILGETEYVWHVYEVK